MTTESLPLVLTCEHAGNAVPAAYAELFQPYGELLASHRGYDIGIRAFAQKLAETLHVPLQAATLTRLLVDLNRSPGHPQLFSDITRKLPAAERQAILSSYYHPYRQQLVQTLEEQLRRTGRVLHLALHSFTPVLHGRPRRAELGLLYDPRRGAEQRLCLSWQRLLRAALPDMRVRRNYPYRGSADGLTTWLRRRYPAESYWGIELEINQRLPLGDADRWQDVQEQLAVSIREVLVEEGKAPAIR